MNKRTLTSILALSLFASFPSQADQYAPPIFSAKTFSGEELEIDKLSRATLIGGLLSAAKDFDKSKAVDFRLRGHALYLAHQLNPDSKKLADIIRQLENRGSTAQDSSATKDRAAGRIYRGIKALIKKKDHPANRTCTIHCVDLALRLSPDFKNAADLKKLQQELGTPDWKGILQKPTYRSPWAQQNANTFRKRTEKIAGSKEAKLALKNASIITVSERAHRPLQQVAHLLTAEATPENSLKNLHLKIASEVGNSTGSSLAWAAKTLKKRHQKNKALPLDQTVTVIFPEKPPLADGSSSGAAMTLILDAMVTGRELDPNFAVIGGIEASGDIKKTKNIVPKILAAKKKKAKLIAIPHQNSEALADFYLTKGLKSALNTPIFTFKTFEDLLSLTSQEKSTTFKEQHAAYQKISSGVQEKGIDFLKEESVKKQLMNIVEKMPTHGSAQLLLNLAQSKLPAHLSLAGSDDAIRNASRSDHRLRQFIWNSNFDHKKNDLDRAVRSTKALEKLKAHIHPLYKDYLSAFAASSQQFRSILEQKKFSDQELVEKLKNSWKEVAKAHRSLSDKLTEKS